MTEHSYPPPPEIIRIVEIPRRGALFWILLLLTLVLALTTALFFLTTLGLAVAGGAEGAGGPRLVKRTYAQGGPDDILLLPVEGVITGRSSDDGVFSQPSTISWVRNQLDEARRDPKVRAVILYIDSPGGEVTASDIIYHDIVKFRRDTGRPVLVLMGDVAASGGYYIACAGDRIVAHNSTITGSIGVILPLFGVQGLLEKIGVEPRAIASAPHKEIGSPYEKMTDEDRALLKGIVDQMQQQFMGVVRDGFKRRNVDARPEEIDALCNGMIFTGGEALKNKLVDKVGYFEDARGMVEQMAGISNARVVMYRRPSLLGALTGEVQSDIAGPRASAADAAFGDTPRFLYLYTAGQGILLSSARKVGRVLP